MILRMCSSFQPEPFPPGSVNGIHPKTTCQFQGGRLKSAGTKDPIPKSYLPTTSKSPLFAMVPFGHFMSLLGGPLKAFARGLGPPPR